jgi:hypothetical protein
MLKEEQQDFANKYNIFITYQNKTHHVSEVLNVREMLLQSYRLHIEPLEILSYNLSTEDGACIDTDE